MDTVEEGWRKFNIGEYGQALKLFQKASLSKDPEVSRNGCYGQGMTYALSQAGADPDAALEIFEQIVKDHPRSDVASWSLLAMARMKQLVAPDENPDYAELRKCYQRLIDGFPGSMAAEEGFLHQQATYLVSLSKDDARMVLRKLSDFIRDNPSSSFVTHAWELLAKCHETLEDPGAQLSALENSLSTQILDPDDPYTDNASLYWSIATLAEFGNGDFAKAREFYQRLGRDYPKDVRNFSAKLAIERMDRVEEAIRKDISASRSADAARVAGGGE